MIAPFVMAGINTRIVRRSHALQGFPYGEAFTYEEAMMTGKGFKGRIRGIAMLLMLGVLVSAKPKGLLQNRTPLYAQTGRRPQQGRA
nr:hypothetical protein [Haliscomenobacter sp.]